MKFASYLIAAALVCAVPQVAAPQPKGADTKKIDKAAEKAAAEKARKENQIRTALHGYNGYNFGSGIHVAVSGYHISIQVPASRISEMCEATDRISLWAYLDAEAVAIIVDTYMRNAKWEHEKRARALEHLARTLGAYQTAGPPTGDDEAPKQPAMPNSAKAQMSLIPDKALAAKK